MNEDTALENLPPGTIVQLTPKQMEERARKIVPLTPEQDDAASIATVLRQNALVDELMTKAMEKDKHYGVIPGTGTKPSLLKPGAEALLRLFRLAPRYTITETSLGGDHFKLDIVCELTHRVTGEFWGEGVATASTKESKWRWRYDDKLTGKPVPKEYWAKRDKSLLGGPHFSAKKVNGDWQIVERGEKVENPDIADQWNTVKKIGRKRALADAILSATGASAIFTQDVDEIGTTPANEKGKTAPGPAVKPQNTAQEPQNDQEGHPEWDGELTFKTGKNKGKAWKEMDQKFLDWALKSGSVMKEMAAKEMARRALLEGEAVQVVDGEVVEDKELQERFKLQPGEKGE